MKTIIKLKINPTVPIEFEDCSFHYDSDTKEIVIVDLENGVQAVYDADVLYPEIIFSW